MYDLIIIGGGPGGYTAAARAGQAGLSVLLIEERELGGVCLHEGCIPSKTLLHSAKIYDYALNGAPFGVTVKDASLDHEFVVSRKDKVVATLASGVKAQMKACGVTVVYGRAYIIDNTHVSVNSEVYDGSRLLVATGSQPVIPPIEGVAEGISKGFVLTSREMLDLREIPDSLAVIGGGVVGLEMASYYRTAGSDVTVIEMLPEIGGTIDSDISALLLKNFEKKGIKFILNARVTTITDNGAGYDGGLISTGKFLLSIGRKPTIEGYGLENTGVVIERGAIRTDHHGLTSIPNIYAVGDVNGKYMLAHAAYREAEVAVNHMLGKRDVMRYDSVPSIIYTSPEVASVGETEETASAKGIGTASAIVPMAYSGRCVAESDVADGICKVVIDKKYRNIIGVHLIGNYASEIISGACMMIEMQMRVDDVKEIVFPHPTVSEIIREAVSRL